MHEPKSSLHNVHGRSVTWYERFSTGGESDVYGVRKREKYTGRTLVFMSLACLVVAWLRDVELAGHATRVFPGAPSMTVAGFRGRQGRGRLVVEVREQLCGANGLSERHMFGVVA